MCYNAQEGTFYPVISLFTKEKYPYKAFNNSIIAESLDELINYIRNQDLKNDFVLSISEMKELEKLFLENATKVDLVK